MKLYNNLRSTILIPEDQFFDSIDSREFFFATEYGSKRLDPTSPAYTPFCKVGDVLYEWLPKDDRHHWVAISSSTEGIPGKPGKDGLSSIIFRNVYTIPWYEPAKAVTYGTTDNVEVDLYIPSGKPGLAPEDIDIMSSNGSFHIRKSIRGPNLTFDITKGEGEWTTDRTDINNLKAEVKRLSDYILDLESQINDLKDSIDSIGDTEDIGSDTNNEDNTTDDPSIDNDTDNTSIDGE